MDVLEVVYISVSICAILLANSPLSALYNLRWAAGRTFAMEISNITNRLLCVCVCVRVHVCVSSQKAGC